MAAQEHSVNMCKTGIQEFTVPSFDLESPLKGAPTMSHKFPVSSSDFNHSVVQAIRECDETAVPEACASSWHPHVPTYLITLTSQRKLKVNTTSRQKEFRI